MNAVNGSDVRRVTNNPAVDQRCDWQPLCTIYGSGQISGTEGDDIICGSEGNDQIAGLGGNDIIYGFGGDDQISGGPGNDRMFGGLGTDSITGGLGTDFISAGPGNDRIVANEGDISYGTDGDQIGGGSGDDFIRGGENVDYLRGGPGDDVIKAGPGKGPGSGDRLDGDAGDDVLDGGRGPDIYVFRAPYGHDRDTIVEDPHQGRDVIEFSDYDQVVGGGEGIPVSVDLATKRRRIAIAGNHIVRVARAGGAADIENVYTGFGDDRIVGNAADNVIRAAEGADTIDCRGGRDTVDRDPADTLTRCERVRPWP
jgi:Ca2+-binding RTX toxin-like protein